MPSYVVEHTYIVKYRFKLDAPTVPDAVATVEHELPKSFWPDKGPSLKTEISTHHIKYEVNIVQPENEKT